MAITGRHYGTTRDGRSVEQYIMDNGSGMRVAVLTFGCIITNIWVPDKSGKERDVVLGYNSLASYETDNAFFGTFVGRYANRIENSEFTVDGVTYRLDPNEGRNHLHGGLTKRVFDASVEDDKLILHTVSPDGDEGFPGNLDVTVTYTLTGENALVMDYTATTDAATIVNFTNHSYFNLDGEETGPVFSQRLMLNAQEFAEDNEENCVTGRILKVKDTPMDFTKEKPIGQDIHADWDQLKMVGGYDHNFILDKAPGMLGLAARARSAESGIMMEAYTTQPGVQLYTGNNLGGVKAEGKSGFRYPVYGGFCLETQHYPCTPSHANFPSVKLEPNDEYHETTIYKFKTE